VIRGWWLSRFCLLREEIRERISKRFSPEECRGCKYWGKYGCMASVDYFESAGLSSCGCVLQGLVGTFPSIPADRYEELEKLYERRANNS